MDEKDDAVERELQAMVSGTLPAAEDLATNEKRKWLTVAEGQKSRRLLGQLQDVLGSLITEFDKDNENPDMAVIILTTAHAVAHAALAELHESMASINRLYGADEKGEPLEEGDEPA